MMVTDFDENNFGPLDRILRLFLLTRMNKGEYIPWVSSDSSECRERRI
jgi:hypothetical protein